MKKAKLFDLSAISIIACDCLQAVICIFIDLFFISRLLNSTAHDVSTNIMSIALFYIVYYFVLASMYSVTGYALKKINKSIFVSIGTIVLTVGIFLIYILGDNVVNFVPLIGVIYGIGYGFFSSGYHNLTSEVISSKFQVKFFAVKRIFYQMTYIIFPISLGFIIDKFGFTLMALVMLFICALLIVFSFLIRPKRSYQLSFKLREFSSMMIKNKKEYKPLWLVYLMVFFRGASYDCFTTLITILVMQTFQSNTSLGMFQSIFTACSLLTLVFYLKFYRKKRARYFVGIPIALVTCTIVGILCATNQITIILFYAVYSILNVVLMSICDSRRAGVVRVLSLHSHILENTAFTEFFQGAGRILGSVLLLLAGLFDGLMGGGTVFLKVALGLVCGLYVMFGISIMWLEKVLQKQDEEFRKAHMGENIEKID